MCYTSGGGPAGGQACTAANADSNQVALNSIKCGALATEARPGRLCCITIATDYANCGISPPLHKSGNSYSMIMVALHHFGYSGINVWSSVLPWLQDIILLHLSV